MSVKRSDMEFHPNRDVEVARVLRGHAAGWVRLWLAAFVVIGLTSRAPTANAEGVFCWRLGNGVCTPMAFISQPLWSIGDADSWRVLPPWTPTTPQPVFPSADAVVQYFVNNNDDVACSPNPRFRWSVFGGVSMATSNHVGGAVSKRMAYTDPEIPADTGALVEEYFNDYRWTIVNWAAGSTACDTGTDIVPVRRRVAVCPAGFVPPLWDAGAYPQPVPGSVIDDPDICFKPIAHDPKTLGDCNGPNEVCGNPISPSTGNKFQHEADIPRTASGTLGLERFYNSAPQGFQELGRNWRHSYDRSIVPERHTGFHQVWVHRPDGKGLRFTMPSSGSQWTGDPDVVDRLYQVVDAGSSPSGWRYVTRADEVETYDVTGRLLSIADRSGLKQTLTYSVAPGPELPKAGLLVQVIDAYGRHLDFGYDAQARITQVTDVNGHAYQYSYDATGMLATVVFPDGSQRNYLYDEAAYTQNTSQPTALTGIVDENGIRFATFSYDGAGRGIATEHSGGVDRFGLNYQVIGATPQTIVTDALGTQRSYAYSSLYGPYTGFLRNTVLTQSCTACRSVSEFRTYDSNGNVTERTDFNSGATLYQYDLARNLETTRIEASGVPQQRTIATQWHPVYRLPAQVTEPAAGGTRTTTFTYDATGNLTRKSIVAPKNDGTDATVTRATSWTYGTLGRVATATDPDGNVTTYSYYADDDPDSGKRGNVASITNAVGDVVQIIAYDPTGRPLSTSDPNGLVTTLAYDARARLVSRQVGVETTGYAYDRVGQLTQVTQPDGSYLQYTYDGAHRLIQVNDSIGNKIVYTLDAQGNRIAENAYDPSGQLARTRTRQFDTLSRLVADIGAQGQTTGYSYDNNGNRLIATDPLNHSSGNIYDSLNRLTQVLDPNLGVTRYAYDLANNLTQVTDARNLVTTYKYDGLGNLVQHVSPDTGTTSNTYDAAGNLLLKTDARGVTSTFVYDRMNRATLATHSNGATNEVHAFQYDAGSNAKGRLTQVTDTSGFTNWTYNSQGRVSTRSQSVDAFTWTLAYGYNSAGQLVSMTTPSGQEVGYGYLNNRVVSVTVNGQPLLQGAATSPFGPISAWRWGNGLYEFRDFDKNGRLASWEFRNGTSILRKDQVFDAAGRIVAINDPNNSAANQTYQYDALDRLIAAQTGTPAVHTQQFSYDPVGNRLSAAADSVATNFAYGATNNRIQTLSGAMPSGYAIGSGNWSFTYSNANRLIAVASGGMEVATYRVNALGQRVRKNVGGTVTYFVYDEQGHLLGEYDGSANLIQETIWLENLPVATLRPSGGPGTPTPVSTYYIHSDHLGTPRAVTRPTDNALMWQWDNLDAFGANAANENPSGQGAFKNALRFPGQYYDTETGTHHNYFRDYDPAIGRYQESDPIRLRGGMSTYAYVAGSPLGWSDQYGLEGGGFSTRYGKWCGKNWSGGHEGPIIPENPAGPIDSVDECCMNHDYCYAMFECDHCGLGADKKAGKQECDHVLVTCLDALKGNPPQNWPKPPPRGKETDAYFFCQKAKWFFQ